ncbi:NFU1 iron-sulfur cluster scaffold homolog, mitochondrial [Seminavis robusta]|uniref:NFU1 iron-sulfur cluster scaffold homolog, mitochondrial n=1 Tax=Seminavis robusta TaxID=568900 RepID=A0A9N8EI73_9STRA|nr:NFU1 iron-sulfur cluster scaffold homolog, mitochondrial [Seminavis robusta]|eukprot:Sro975_g226850.1 NFU1 iron-sulfur cluster scaffold homolog, mitochondrial (292) ;mRNA; f:32207-33168
MKKAATTMMNSTRVLRALSAATGRGRSSSVLLATGRSVSHLVANTTPGQTRSTIRPQPVVSVPSRSIFVQSVETPNPESLKFVPTGIVVLPDGDVNGFFVSKSDPQESILRSPLAKQLFQIDGVKAVYLGADFVTITKVARSPWKSMRPQILDVLMNFFDEDVPALLDQPEFIDTTILDDDDEIVAMIKELIESRIRPAVQEDGGDIRYVSFEEETGLCTVELAGSCVGCPSSSVTLKQGVENMLQHYVPEVTAVVALEEEVEESEEAPQEEKKQKTYEERLAAAGIPFSD